MRKVDSIADVDSTYSTSNQLFYNKNIGNVYTGLYSYKESEICVYEGLVYLFDSVKDYYAIRHHPEDGGLIFLDHNFNVTSELRGDSYLVKSYLDSYFSIVIDEKKKLYDKNLKSIEVNEFYRNELSHLYLGRSLKNKHIRVFSKTTQELLWEKDVSLPEYGEYTSLRGEVCPNQLACPAMADEDTIYLSMEGGQLIALNATDGSTKWILEGDKPGTCVLYKHLIYKNTGRCLVIIDVQKEKEIQRIDYRKDFADENDRYNMNGEFNVYEDIIVMKSMGSGRVTLIDRKTLERIDYIILENGIKNTSADCTVWHNNRLYAIDCNYVMHIYELDESSKHGKTGMVENC